MSLRVCVVMPPMSVARDFIDYPYVANLGAAQVAAVLRDQGFEVALVDAFAMTSSTLRWRPDGRAHLGASVDEVAEAVRAEKADAVVVALTPFHCPPNRDDLLGGLLARLRPETPRLVLADCYQSGQHYVEADGVLEAYPEADLFVKYEAEAILGDVLFGAQRGIVRGPEAELGALPPPAWDLIALPAYWRFHRRVRTNLGRGTWAFPLGERTLPMVTSRGCPFTCIHCSSNPGRTAGTPKTQRRFSKEQLAEHVALLAKLGADRLFVLDELINVRKSHFEHFLQACEEHRLRFEVPNGFRADYLDEGHFGRLRERLTTISVSAESGSRRVVEEVVQKKLDLGAIEKAAERAARAGVPLLVHYMIGLPGEGPEEINQTLAFALRLWDEFRAWPAVQFATPLPGTRLAAKAEASPKRGLPVVDWGPQFQKAQDLRWSGGVGDAELRTFMRTFQRRLRESTGPKKLIMNVTYVCNNRCTFCAVGTRTQVDGHPTRQREFLAKYRRHGITMVDFDGGEPTLNPELVPLIRHARRLGYERINVTTNGRLCAYEGFAKKLVRSGLTTLLFSVHGPDLRSHAREVGVAEAFSQTIDGIRHCVAAAPAGVELGMNITLTKTNFRRLDEVAQLAWDLGLRWLNIQFLTPFGRATQTHAPDTAEAAAVTREVIDAWKDRMKIQVINLPWCFLPDHEEHVVGDSQKLARHMIFVNNESVNLGDYLAERRRREPVCESCAYSCFCSGFYELKDVPEPEWLVEPESLLRKVGPELDAR